MIKDWNLMAENKCSYEKIRTALTKKLNPYDK